MGRTMAIGSFFKSLFGGGDAQPAPMPAPAAPTVTNHVAEAQAFVRTTNRREDPLNWADGQQRLAYAIYGTTADMDRGKAIPTYREILSLLNGALEAIETRDHNPQFRASILNLRGEVGLRLAETVEGNEKGEALAQSATDLGHALIHLTPANYYDLWERALLYRGSALTDLAAMKDGDQGLAWLDDAAACFEDLNIQGRRDESGTHPIAAYNLYVVLEKRAERTDGVGALPFYQKARQYLAAAATSPAFAHRPQDTQTRLAALDQAIARFA